MKSLRLCEFMYNCEIKLFIIKKSHLQKGCCSRSEKKSRFCSLYSHCRTLKSWVYKHESGIIQTKLNNVREYSEWNKYSIISVFRDLAYSLRRNGPIIWNWIASTINHSEATCITSKMHIIFLWWSKHSAVSPLSHSKLHLLQQHFPFWGGQIQWSYAKGDY